MHRTDLEKGRPVTRTLVARDLDGGQKRRMVEGKRRESRRKAGRGRVNDW